ncbi:MAG TPA: DUF6048 family protein [Prolixibacteraceae bacterium]|jgi:hypothetical protein
MKILSFTFILCLLAASSFAQPEQKKKYKPKRTDQYIHMKGIRFGMDVTRPFQDLWTKGNRYGTEFSADMELWPSLYSVFETGYERLNIKTPYIDYSGKGSYSRIGIDYNLLQAEHENDKDELYIGLRYGFAFAGQQINHYLIDSYWGPETGGFGNQSFPAHWGEILLGIKGEIFHNFYMGWTIRGKVKLSNKQLNPPVYFIPGYGKAEKGFNLDFTYSVYYNIPWDFRKSAGVKKLPVKNEIKTPDKK